MEPDVSAGTADEQRQTEEEEWKQGGEPADR
jgi:hypothetical protein